MVILGDTKRVGVEMVYMEAYGMVREVLSFSRPGWWRQGYLPYNDSLSYVFVLGGFLNLCFTLK